MKRAIPALLCGVLLSACTVIGPNYERPKIDAPASWRIDYGEAAEVANARWWEQLDDPVLNQLIDDALRANPDLRAAAGRVDQFIGALTSARALYYPQIGYSFDASRNRASERAFPGINGIDPYYNLYQGALSASWQIDLFGRVQRQSEAAQARVYASEQGRRGVVLSVVSSVAGAYVTLRGFDHQLEIARATAQNYAQTVNLFDLRFKGGVVSMVEVTQADSQYQQALAAIPALEDQIAAQENLISILLGRNPGPIPRGKPLMALVPPKIPADLPAGLLERRPDIMQAEQTLIATNADIGYARSLYYPTFSLTGLLGSVSVALGDFLTGPARIATLAAGLSGPIFTGGAIEGQVATAEGAQREALALYERTILNAFRETNDALVGSQKKRQEAELQARRVISLREYARLARLRFEEGATSYQEVLYAENELFNAELVVVRTQTERYLRLVDVYRSIGGGWVDWADELTVKPVGTLKQ